MAYASPATVSRCGMVYMEPSALGTGPLLQSWSDRHRRSAALLPVTVAEPVLTALATLADAVLGPCIDFVRRNCVERVATVNASLVAGTLRLVECLLREILSGGLSITPTETTNPTENDDATSIDRSALLPQLVEPVFYFAVVWSVGATCGADGRERFDKFLRAHMVRTNATALFPAPGLVYDYQLRLIDGKEDCHVVPME